MNTAVAVAPSLTPQTIYQRLIWRIALATPHNAAADIDLQQYAGDMTPQEIEVVFEMHRDAVQAEFSLDPSWCIRHLKGEVSTEELLKHLRDMTNRVVCDAIREDVLVELDDIKDDPLNDDPFDDREYHRPLYIP